MPGETSLKSELQLYRANKHEWLPFHQDQFVVISGQTVAGFYPDFESAYRAGVRRFGFRDLLIKLVCAVDPVYVIF
ncbi:MAG: hypothetical protein ACLP6G_13645 [Terriglobales bacterium]